LTRRPKRPARTVTSPSLVNATAGRGRDKSCWASEGVLVN
jgi:hypothetical protein